MPEVRRVARVSPSALYREVQGEAVLLHLDTGEYFGLDPVATRIWQLIVEKGDLEEVQASMLDEYEADETAVRQDLQRLVEELVERRLIEVDQLQPDELAQ